MENRFINLILENNSQEHTQITVIRFSIYLCLSNLVALGLPRLFIEVRMALGLKIRMRAAQLGLLRLSKSGVAGSLYLGGVL